MYKCDTCGYETERLPTYEEHHPYGEGTATEITTDTDCPFCVGGELMPAVQCGHCGKWFVDDGNELCPSCGKATVVAFKMFCNSLDETQKCYLNEFFDGTEVFA